MNAQLAASPWRIDWERLGRRLLIALLCLFGAGALVAAKLLAWPLVIWMLVTRRTRGAAITVVSAAGLALAGWSLIGMHGLLGYPGLLAADAHAFEARSHSLVAVAMSLGLPAG